MRECGILFSHQVNLIRKLHVVTLILKLKFNLKSDIT